MKKTQVHPECVSWDYPVRSFTNQYFQVVRKTPRASSTTQKFWFIEPADRSCHVCGQSQGQFVKCRYYSCQTHYHVTCARKVGVVRQLEKMLVVANTNTYIPVYCSEHLMKRVSDFKQKAEKAQKERNRDKANHLFQLHKIYQAQVDILNQTKIYEQNLDNMFKVEFIVQQVDESVSQSEESVPIEEPKDMQKYSSQFCSFLDREMRDWQKESSYKIKAQIGVQPMEVEEVKQNEEPQQPMSQDY